MRTLFQDEQTVGRGGGCYRTPDGRFLVERPLQDCAAAYAMNRRQQVWQIEAYAWSGTFDYDTDLLAAYGLAEASFPSRLAALAALGLVLSTETT